MVWRWERGGWTWWPAGSLLSPDCRDQRERPGEVSLTKWTEALCGGGSGRRRAQAVLRHLARAGSRRFDRSISHVSLLCLLWPLSHQFSLSFPSHFLCPSHHTSSLLSFPASFPLLFLFLSSCQNPPWSHHVLGALWNSTVGINHHFLCSHSDCLIPSL